MIEWPASIGNGGAGVQLEVGVTSGSALVQLKLKMNNHSSFGVRRLIDLSPLWPGCRQESATSRRTPYLQKGVRDMLCISDSRASGTSYGACVLHVAPESFGDL